MWSRYSISLPRWVSDYQEKTHRSLFNVPHRQSLGSRQLDQVRIDCSFMPDSKWGVLEDDSVGPAWLLYLQLQFSQPTDCKLAGADVKLTFEKMRPQGLEQVDRSKLGPIVTDYFGPRDARSPSIDANPMATIVSFPTGGESAVYQEADMQWSLRGYTWADDSGLYRQVQWIMKEASPPYQTILHRDQVRVGLVLGHDLEPFFITVHIEGELQGDHRWLKFKRPNNPPGGCICVKVEPVHDRTRLDDLAKQLNMKMTERLFESPRINPNISETTKVMGLHGNSSGPNTGPCREHHRPATISRETEKTHKDYTVGWICALPIEMAAASAMLDEIHPVLSSSPSDQNSYILGSIGPHNIAMACLPQPGTTPAATVANYMSATFPSIRFCLIVGIGGGVPSETNDIRLGDVVVSQPDGRLGGVVQYDYGKMLAQGKFQQTGALNKPPFVLLATVAKLRAEHKVSDNQIRKYLREAMARYPKMKSLTHPGEKNDRLYKAGYEHVTFAPTCENCDETQRVSRQSRAGDTPMVHYGIIACGNRVMKDGCIRDPLAK